MSAGSKKNKNNSVLHRGLHPPKLRDNVSDFHAEGEETKYFSFFTMAKAKHKSHGVIAVETGAKARRNEDRSCLNNAAALGTIQ